MMEPVPIPAESDAVPPDGSDAPPADDFARASFDVWLWLIRGLAVAMVLSMVYFIFEAIPDTERLVASPEAILWPWFQAAVGLAALAGAVFLLVLAHRIRREHRKTAILLTLFAILWIDASIVRLGSLHAAQRLGVDFEEVARRIPPGASPDRMREVAGELGIAISATSSSPTSGWALKGERERSIRLLHRRFSIHEVYSFWSDADGGLVEVSMFRFSDPRRWAGRVSLDLRARDGEWWISTL